ncbi:DUF4232 domain-containing protein [Kutzneria buriramensis]|uniref:Uncharacterized protein DUF4232 n=1 Tax=Kutzneria buriramensis TaxID=1045776 RepID=A0A3E0GYW4_9PSEU|nr:DUF4232 domain-containing protein [Kutzneria buriramensis]REH34856.1 uncharacterized protein DUF4232 [Kutzneria buriramensis]
MARLNVVLLAGCGVLAACATTSTVATPSTTASTVATSTTAAAAPCRTESLRVSLGQGEGAAGHHYVPIVFTNAGPACTITGFPGVSYYAGADQHQVGDAAAREPGAPTAIVLGPDSSAYAWLNQVNVDNYDPAVCQPVAATGLRVYPPDNTAFVLLPEPNARGCTRPMDGQQLTVRAVQGGSSPH